MRRTLVVLVGALLLGAGTGVALKLARVERPSASAPSDSAPSCAPCGADATCWNEACFETIVARSPEGEFVPSSASVVAPLPPLKAIALSASGLTAASVESGETGPKTLRAHAWTESGWTSTVLAQLKCVHPNQYALAISGDGRVVAFTCLGVPWISLFELRNGTWEVSPPGLASGKELFGGDNRHLGLELSETGDLIVVESSSPGRGSGAVVFQREPGSSEWASTLDTRQVASLDEIRAASSSVSADGTRLVLGCLRVALLEASTPLPCAVSVYDRVEGEWRRSARIEAPPGASGFGAPVALSPDGRSLFIGAEVETPGPSVYAFSTSGSGWRLSQRLPFPATSASIMTMEASAERLLVLTSPEPRRGRSALWEFALAQGRVISGASSFVPAMNEFTFEPSLARSGRRLTAGSAASGTLGLFER